MAKIAFLEPWRALSLWQPWAHIVANGTKKVENRPRQTHLRGRFLIHAGLKKDDPMGCVAMCERLGVALPDVRHLKRGGIVGVATIVDCVSNSKDPWFFGPYGYVLKDAQPLPFVPCRGELGFFKVDDSVVIELRRLAPEAGL